MPVVPSITSSLRRRKQSEDDIDARRSRGEVFLFTLIIQYAHERYADLVR